MLFLELRAEMSVILIDGWGGSGKSLLLSYLDSHPEIFAIPVHDKLVYDILKLNSKNLNTNDNDIRQIRRSLSSHGYYNIEYNATREVMPVLLSTEKDDILEVPFKFNFEEFERSWKRALLERRSFTKEEFIDILYEAFYQNVETKNVKTELRHFATMGDSKSCSPQKFLENYPSSKLIYVKRDISELIGIRSNRQTPTGLRQGMFEKDFLSVILSAEVQKIIDYEHKIKSTQTNNPDRVLIVEFEELFDNQMHTLNNVQKFLDLPSEKLFPTMMGYKLGDETQNYGSQKNDSVNNLLSPSKILYVKFFEKIGRKIKILNKILLLSLNLISLSIRALRYILK